MSPAFPPSERYRAPASGLIGNGAFRITSDGVFQPPAGALRCAGSADGRPAPMAGEATGDGVSTGDGVMTVVSRAGSITWTVTSGRGADVPTLLTVFTARRLGPGPSTARPTFCFAGVGTGVVL